MPKIQNKFILLYNLLLLINTQTPTTQKQSLLPFSSPQIQIPNLLQLCFTIFSVLLVLIQTLVWHRSYRQQTIISFSIVTNQIPSQSNNTISIKNQQSNVQNSERLDSNTIKPSHQLIEQETRKKRKRKADRLSDRRKKGNQDEEHDQENGEIN